VKSQTRVFSFLLTLALLLGMLPALSPSAEAATMSLEKSSLEMWVGDSRYLQVSFSEQIPDDTMAWSCSAPDVIRLTDRGGSAFLEALAPGTATIRVWTVNDSYSATCHITVNPNQGESGGSAPSDDNFDDYSDVTISLTPAMTLYPGQVRGTLYGFSRAIPNEKDLTISSSNPAVATAEPSPSTAEIFVTAHASGKATITVKALHYDISATIAVTVTGNVAPKPVVPETIEVSVPENGAFQNTPIPLPIPKITLHPKENASTVKVDVPTGGSMVEVPVTNVTTGTVAFLVHPDGREELVKTCYVSDNGLVVHLAENASLKVVDNSKTFTDVKDSDWYNAAVDFVSARGLMNGTGNDQFTPGIPVSHAMAWTMLANLNDQPINGGTTWYEKSRAWAMGKGLTDGSNPDGVISRQELALLLWAQAGKPASSQSFDGFTDTDEISAQAETALRWAVETKIMSGKGNGKLDPTGSTSRSEIAQMFKNFVHSGACQ